jgi:hypothetical protein
VNGFPELGGQVDCGFSDAIPGVGGFYWQPVQD